MCEAEKGTRAFTLWGKGSADCATSSPFGFAEAVLSLLFRLTLNILSTPGRSQFCDPPASASWLLGLQGCATLTVRKPILKDVPNVRFEPSSSHCNCIQCGYDYIGALTKSSAQRTRSTAPLRLLQVLKSRDFPTFLPFFNSRNSVLLFVCLFVFQNEPGLCWGFVTLLFVLWELQSQSERCWFVFFCFFVFLQ